MKFQLEAWSAIAPGLDSAETWRNWLQCPEKIVDTEAKVTIKQIPPMIRRRFRSLGKCAVGAALPLLSDEEVIASIFSSRHGDTELTYSLLEEICTQETVSPTNFSLAVHNAIGGLFSIARKDHSEVTSMAAMEGIVIQTICEALGQLHNKDRVLCIIYDIPLPEFFHKYESGDSFPYAIAMILSNSEGDVYQLERCNQDELAADLPSGKRNSEPFALLEMFTGLSEEIILEVKGCVWRITKATH